MKTSHSHILADVWREDVTTAPDDAIGFFDDCASACLENSSSCCTRGSETHVEDAPTSGHHHKDSIFPSPSENVEIPSNDSSLSKTSSSLQAQYSTHTPKQSIYYWQTYIEPHVSASEKIDSAKGKRTANATPTSQTTMATIMLRSDSSTAETPTSSVRGGALMTGETAPDSTDLVPSTMGSVPATTATEPTPTNASNSEPHRMPPMSIALLVISGIVIVVVSLLGLGCWMKRRRRPRSVNEMVAVEEEMDELHELGQQYTKSRTYRSVSRNTNRSSRIFPSRSASRATNASRTTNSSSSTNASRKTKASSSTISSTSSRPHQSIPRTTTLVEPSAK